MYTLCIYFQVLLWEEKADIATVEELEQFYVLCPVAIKDGYLVETVRKFKEEHTDVSIMIFTDTCK